MSSTSVVQGRICMISAAVLWSTSAIFAKGLDLPGPIMAFYRALFAAIFLAAFLPKDARPLRWTGAMWGMVICFATMNVSFVSAMTATTAANAIFLQYTAPVWMLLACRFWLKEPVDFSSFLSVVVGLLGVAIIVGSEITREGLGVVLGLLSGVSFGLLAVFLRRLRSYHPWWLTFLNHAFAALLLIPILMFLGRWEQLADINRWQVFGLLGFGVIQMALPYVLFSQALRSISPQEAGILGLLEPLLNPIWAYLWVGEVPSRGTLTGGAVLLAAILVRYIPLSKTRP